MGLHCHFLVDSLSVMNHCLHLDKSPRSFSSESVREKVPDGNTALNHLRGECQAVYFPSGWGPSCKLYCPDSSQAGSWGWGRQVFPSLPGSGHTREQGPPGWCHEPVSRGHVTRVMTVTMCDIRLVPGCVWYHALYTRTVHSQHSQPSPQVPLVTQHGHYLCVKFLLGQAWNKQRRQRYVHICIYQLLTINVSNMKIRGPE